MIAANLLAVTLLIGFTGGRWLPAARWAPRAPRLAIAAWCVLLGTVGAGVAAVGVTVLLPAPPVVCALLLWCVHPASPGAALALRVVGDAVALGWSGAALTAAVRAGRLLRTRIGARRRHREMLTLAGRPDAALGGTVIESARPAAYLAPGRRVVVTSGALDHLSAAQLEAVLAHERAHAGGRHQFLLDVVRLAAWAVPVRLLRTAQEQIGRLVELRADDVAARAYGRHALATALLTMAGAGPVAGGLVAAHGGDATERLRRLLVPPRRLGAWTTAAIGAALALVVVLPAVALLLDGAWPSVVRCVWIG